MTFLLLFTNESEGSNSKFKCRQIKQDRIILSASDVQPRMLS